MIVDLPPVPPSAARPAVPPSALLESLLLKPRQLTVFANGLQFAYLEWGPTDGPLVLCLHGFPVSPTTWEKLGPTLGALGYRVVAPWMRGYAPTQAPAGDAYGATVLGDDVLALMTALGADQAVLVGHDWGALAAYTAAAKAPERVVKLVAVAIPHPAAIPVSALLKAHHFLTLPLPGAVGRLSANDYAEVETIMRRWSPAWKLPPAEVESAKQSFRAPGGAHAILGYYRAALTDQAAPLPPLSVPTLAVFGMSDGALDADVYYRTEPYFTGPYRRLGLAAGHFPHREQPEQFERAVRFFLAE